MIYKAVTIIPFTYKGLNGRETTQNTHGSVGVGRFENEDSKSYSLLCTIDKNVGTEEDQTIEANRIANLLNENRKYFTKEEVEKISQI